MRNVSASREILELYYTILLDVFKKKGVDETTDVKRIEAEMRKNQERLSNIRKLLADNKIDAKDYSEMKVEYEKAIFDLQREKDKLRDTKENVEEYINYSLSLLKHLDIAYVQANTEAKKKLIGSIFPDKIIFSGNKCRTTKDRFLIDLIRRSSVAKRGNEKGHNGKNSVMPSQVESEGFEPSSKQGTDMLSTCL